MPELLARFIRSVLFLLVASGIVLGHERSTKLLRGSPADVGMRSEHLDRIDTLVQEGLDRGQMPGCVVAIGRRGKLVFLKAYGHKQLEPEMVPMTTDTVFDMASITKPVATATSIMILVERGQVRLRNHVSDYIPDFGANGKKNITIMQLLTHHGGLIPDNPISDYADGAAESFRRINNLSTHVDPGSKFVYTDVGFIVLGDIVRQVSGKDLDQFSRENIFGPLNMRDSGFRPDADLKQRAAPTEQRDGKWIQGEVHDPRAYRLDGVAGHAGLFSTAEDMAIYAQMMLQSGRYDNVRIMSPRSVSVMTQPREVSGNLRALGWDKLSVYSSNRAELFSDQAFGHGGFTGTVLWIDPELELFFLFLSNRVHPNGKGSINALAGRLAAVAVASIDDRPAFASEHRREAVLTGLDVLSQDQFQLLKDQRIGLITNQTGLDRRGHWNVHLLDESPDVNLCAIFSPEHGLEGKLDIADIGDSSDARTGLKIFSLYGKNRQPTSAQLSEVDTLVFDIQDIGTRFYTYVSTMGLAMRSAAQHGKRFVVLDRPNPINGVTVDGPILDPGRESFVGFHTLPVRHGMTTGELAKMFAEEMNLNLDLHVVRMKNWHRDMYFDETDRMWVNPSPNMRNLNQALLYPGIGLLETTNLSVGRGTDTPFERVGAPWIDGLKFARSLNNAALAGVRFTPIRFRPAANVFKNQDCEGVQILITNRAQLNPLDVGFKIATTLQSQYPETWKIEAYGRLLADDRVLASVRRADRNVSMRKSFENELNEFQQRRAKFLLYH